MSVVLARLDWADLWRVMVRDQSNMVLYHVLLHGWVHLGTSELVVRSLSALETPSFGRWASYAITGTLLVYTHLFGALVLAAHFEWAILWSDAPHKRRGLLVGGTAITLLTSPLFPLIPTSNHLWWAPPPT